MANQALAPTCYGSHAAEPVVSSPEEVMYDKTRKNLILMIELLEQDESRWSQLFQKALAAFVSGEYQLCAEIILSGSGGMGSLNDLVLGQTTDQSGNFQWKPNYEEINNQFQELLSSLYAFAQGMRRVATKKGTGRL